MSERSERGLKKGVSIYFMRKGERAETGASLKGGTNEIAVKFFVARTWLELRRPPFKTSGEPTGRTDVF